MSLTEKELHEVDQYEKSLHRGEKFKKVVSHPGFLVFLFVAFVGASTALILL